MVVASALRKTSTPGGVLLAWTQLLVASPSYRWCHSYSNIGTETTKQVKLTDKIVTLKLDNVSNFKTC